MADAPSTLESTYLEVDGVRWHALAGGPKDAPPVVLVHGLSISSAYMAPTAERLASHLRVHAIDLPGFGLSGKPPQTLDIRGLAEALVRWMGAAGMPRASFLANSLGCQVVTALAVLHPHRAERLVLLGPSADPDAGTSTVARRLLHDALHEDPKLLFLHARDDMRAGVRRIWRTARSAMTDDIYQWAPACRTPTLILRGARDPVFPEAAARRLARRMPNAIVAEIPDAPHAANYSAPEAVVHASMDFFLGRHPAFPPGLGSDRATA